MTGKEKTARKIVDTLKKNGFEAVFAGGCVRDRERGVEPKDFDIATSARPEEIQRIFGKTIPVGIQFGVILVLEENETFEVATFRTDEGYEDGRHPVAVNFSSLEEDAKRRDFTVNGLYLDTVTNKVVDFVGGKKDITGKVIRTIGDADKRFLEDHLRLLRAVRFAVQLDFTIEKHTLQTIKRHAPLIGKVSAERVRDELTKILTSASPARGVRMLDELGLLVHILPEMETMKGVEQPMEYHPEGDVFIHTLMLVDGLKNAPFELAMGCLLHDVAKPATFVRAEDRIRFHGHDKIGAEMSEVICKRLALSNDQTEIICCLVSEHLRFKDALNMRVSTLKRFLSLPHFDWHLELHRLDCLASHGDLTAHKFCTEKWEAFKKEPPPPLRLINGEDLKSMGFAPGPQFSKILRAVEDEILENKIHSREDALAYVKQNYKPGQKI